MTGKAMRKNQKRRLKKARSQARRTGGTIDWKDGKPVVVGGSRTPVKEVDSGRYLKLDKSVPMSSIFAQPPEEGKDDI